MLNVNTVTRPEQVVFNTGIEHNDRLRFLFGEQQVYISHQDVPDKLQFRFLNCSVWISEQMAVNPLRSDSVL